MKTTLRTALLCTLFAWFSSAYGGYYENLEAELGLTGAARLLGPDETTVLNLLSKAGPEGGKLTYGAVQPATGQAFSVKRSTSLTAYPRKHWDTRMQIAASNVSIASGDKLVAVFWVKLVSGYQDEGYLQFKLRDNAVGSFGDRDILVNSQWRRHVIVLTAPGAMTNLEFRFNAGYILQTVEIAGIGLYNAGTGPVPAESSESFPDNYAGRTSSYTDTSQAWLNEAKQRIDQIRRAQVGLTVKDGSGNPIPGADVRFRMLRHAFKFGGASAPAWVNENGNWNPPNYVNNLFFGMGDNPSGEKTGLQGLNSTVFLNSMKWENWALAQQNNPPPNNGTDNAVARLGGWDVGVRGHTLIWGDYTYVPDGAGGLTDALTPMKAGDFTPFYQHIADIVGRYSYDNPSAPHRIYAWDVLNEVFARYNWEDNLGYAGFVAEAAEWFRRARSHDSQTQMFINDNDILASAGLHEVRSQYYLKLIADLQAELAATGDDDALNGMGFQSHFNQKQLIPPVRMKQILDRYAALGMRLHITEFDQHWGTKTRNQINWTLKSDFLRDFMTMFFSLPNADSFTIWNPYATTYDQSPQLFDVGGGRTPMGDEFVDLVFNHWWTDETQASNTSGDVSLRAFKGDYEIIVTVNGVSKSFNTSLSDDIDLAYDFDNGVVQSGSSGADDVSILFDHTSLSAQGEKGVLTVSNLLPGADSMITLRSADQLIDISPATSTSVYREVYFDITIPAGYELDLTGVSVSAEGDKGFTNAQVVIDGVSIPFVPSSGADNSLVPLSIDSGLPGGLTGSTRIAVRAHCAQSYRWLRLRDLTVTAQVIGTQPQPGPAEAVDVFYDGSSFAAQGTIPGGLVASDVIAGPSCSISLMSGGAGIQVLSPNSSTAMRELRFDLTIPDGATFNLDGVSVRAEGDKGFSSAEIVIAGQSYPLDPYTAVDNQVADLALTGVLPLQLTGNVTVALRIHCLASFRWLRISEIRLTGDLSVAGGNGTVIGSLTTNTTKTDPIIQSDLQNGASFYSDKANWTYHNLPTALSGAQYVRFADADTAEANVSHEIQVTSSGTLYLAIRGLQGLPSWAFSRGFVDSGTNIQVNKGTAASPDLKSYKLYQLSVGNGETVDLGALSGANFYGLIAVPQ